MSVACWRLKLVRMLKFPSPRRRLFPSDNNGLGEDDGVAKWEEVMSDCHSLNIQREYKIMYAPTSATKKLSSFKVHWRNPWHVMMTKLEKRILVWEFLVFFFFFNTTSDVPADKGFSQFFFKSMMTTIPPHSTTSCTVISCSKTSMIIYIVSEDSEILLRPTNPCRLLSLKTFKLSSYWHITEEFKEFMTLYWWRLNSVFWVDHEKTQGE
jgi:hypothetical protein